MSLPESPNPSTYANHAGTSYPKPDAVRRAIAETLTMHPAGYRVLFQRARAIVAEHLQADPERLLFCSSCTQALDVALTELAFEPGDVLVTSRLEHTALTRPAELLVRHRGVRRHRIGYAPGRPFDLEELERVLSAGGVRLVAISAASNVTGEVLPVAEAAALAHAHGARLLVDAAQTFGLLETSVLELDCDLLVFAGHKNPLGPQGIGALWVKAGVEMGAGAAACELPATGAGSVCASAMPGYCEVGGVNMAALAGLSAGLEAFGEQRAERARRARAMGAELARWAKRQPALRVFGHAGAPQTGVVSLTVDELPLGEVEERLARLGVSLRAGTHCAPEALEAIGAGQGTVRISFGPMSPAESCEAVCEALAGCLR